MIPYLLLMLVPIPFAFFSADIIRGKNSVMHIQLRVHKNAKSNDKNMLLYIFFIILFLLLAFRANSVGTDTYQYSRLFEIYGQSSLLSLLYLGRDILFRLIIHIIYNTTGNFQVFLMIMALLEVVPIAYVYLKDREYSYLKMILFLNMVTFCVMFTAIRQTVAIAFGVLAYYFISKNKLWGYIMCGIVAFGFHTSGIMVFLLYPISKLRLKKKSIIIISVIAAVIFIYNRQIFTILMQLYTMISAKEYDSISSTGAYTSLVLFVLFVLFSFFVSDDEKMDDEAQSLRNILVVSVFLQCFAPLHTLAMRINYYFISLIPLAVCKALECQDERYAEITKIGEIVLSVFFAGYYLYTIVSGYIEGSGPLDILPYLPFWKGYSL